MSKKILFTALTLIVVFIALELSLRITGFFTNPIDPIETSWVDDKDKIRVLVIGESTTEAHWDNATDLAWPGVLERKLNENKKGKKYKFYNLGLSATTTLMVLNKIDQQLEQYNPHIVISMLGINDEWLLRDANLRYSDSSRYRLSFFFKRLRSVKLVKHIIERLRDVSKEFEGYHEDEEIMAQIVKSTYSDLKKMIEGKSKEELKILFKNLAISIEYSDYYKKSVEPYEKLREVMVEAGWKLIELGERDSFLFTMLVRHQHDMLDYQACDKVFRLSYESKKSILVCDVAMGTRCHTKVHGQNADSELLEYFGSVYKDGHYFDNYIYHYRLFHQKVIDSGARHIALQYSNFPVNTLRYVFSSHYSNSPKTLLDVIQTDNTGMAFKKDPKFSKLYIIDNQDFSEKYSSHYTFDDLYIDHIFGGTGHYTIKGHQLFAENLKEKIEPILNEHFD